MQLARGLVRRYRGFVALDGVDLTLATGEAVALLGPNGAGKTTTIGCISGLLQPTAGRVRVLGHDVATDGRAAKQAIDQYQKSFGDPPRAANPFLIGVGAGTESGGGR